MQLRAGIPLISDVEELKRNAVFERHVSFNRAFLARHAQAMKSYGAHWGEDPLRLWSRRWEYPFTAEAVIRFAGTYAHRPLKVVDAGSGVTYFPYLLCDTIGDVEVVCVDNDASYHRQFAEINKAETAKVSFVEANLQRLPLADRSVDAITCISVLEHTDRYGEILEEFARVLKPGGLLALTFDLSLDGRFELSYEQAQTLLRTIQERFSTNGSDPLTELKKMNQPQELLSTGHVKRTEPELLPWKHPMLKGLHDLLHGKGWTGGFRSKSVFCLEAHAK